MYNMYRQNIQGTGTCEDQGNEIFHKTDKV